jgi:hypothetical protein
MAENSVMARSAGWETHFVRRHDPNARHSGAVRAVRGQNPTAFAGLQTRTPQAARSASAMDGASQSIFIFAGERNEDMDVLLPSLQIKEIAAPRSRLPHRSAP